MQSIIRKAFTLIELLVVIAIIGILSGLIVVTMNGVTAKANIAKSQVFSNSLRNALMLNLVSEWKFDGSGKNDNSVLVMSDTDYLVDNWGDNDIYAINLNPKIRTGNNCVYGACVEFSEESAGIYVGDSDNLYLGSGFSLEFWFYPSTSTSSANIYKGSNEWQAYYGESTFYFHIRDDDTSGYVGKTFNKGASGVGYGQWNHLVISWNGGAFSSGIRGYMNGKDVSGILSDYNSGVFTAMRNTSADFTMQNLTGEINRMDGVRIYMSPIPTSLIKENYYTGLNSLLSSGNIDFEEYRRRIDSLAGI
ncbi:MAG: prepilin-type N-terminal cleavage/methylation domain-containing protein [Candidatus Pacebacteria bacterium]|nr:prepilin-type N-terminal cleavage/methylation domain-containing protein [Candidatus Paceibacterota bacterium]